MAIENTRDAFLYALGDIYDGENHLLDAQQHMFEHATDADLLGVLRPHIAQTERHVMALEVYWAKTCCTATLPSTCQPQGLLNAACVCPADRREAHAL